MIDTVKRGEMVRDVRGNGTLVPEVTRWVLAPAEGRVETLPLQAGVEVTADTVIAELSNPQMEQQATDAEFQVKAAEADEENSRCLLLVANWSGLGIDLNSAFATTRVGIDVVGQEKGKSNRHGKLVISY